MRVLITVPARQEVWSNYDEYYGHYRRYDLAKLRATITSIGFIPSELGYLYGLLPPALLLPSLGMERPVSPNCCPQAVPPPDHRRSHRDGVSHLSALDTRHIRNLLSSAFRASSILIAAVGCGGLIVEATEDLVVR